MRLLQTVARLTKADARAMTVRQFTRAVAARGGFLGRKRDGEPGWQTLWRGWRELELIAVGLELASLEGDVGNG